MNVKSRRVKLTDRFVKSATTDGRKSPIFMDDEVIGFGVQVRETGPDTRAVPLLPALSPNDDRVIVDSVITCPQCSNAKTETNAGRCMSNRLQMYRVRIYIAAEVGELLRIRSYGSVPCPRCT